MRSGENGFRPDDDKLCAVVQVTPLQKVHMSLGSRVGKRLVECTRLLVRIWPFFVVYHIVYGSNLLVASRTFLSNGMLTMHSIGN
jgi:hypothetical protein